VKDLWSTGRNKNVKNLQHFLIEDIREVNTFNKNVLEQKRNTLVAAKAATGVEVLFVRLTLIYLVRDKLVSGCGGLGGGVGLSGVVGPPEPPPELPEPLSQAKVIPCILRS